MDRGRGSSHSVVSLGVQIEWLEADMRWDRRRASWVSVVAVFHRIADRLGWEFREWRRPSRPSFLLEELDRALLDELSWRPGERVLDVGCGGGAYLRALRARGAEVCGVDLSREALCRASAGGAPVAAASALALPFRGETFDTVLCHRTLYLFDDPDTVAREFAAVLRRGGRLVFSGSNVRSPYARTQALALRMRRNRRWGVANRLSVGEWVRVFARHGFGQDRLYSCNLVWPLVFRIHDRWIIPNEWMRRYARWVRRRTGLPLESGSASRWAQDYLVVVRKRSALQV